MRHLLLAFFVCHAIATWSQTVQKCCGTGNSTFLLGNLTTANHSQCLYTPSDLSNSSNGAITRLYYRYGTTGQALGNTLSGFMIRLTQTAATAFAGGNTFFTGLDTVLTNASYSIPPGTSGEWFAIDLDSSFTFDASMTLVVDITFTGSATTNFGTMSTSMAGRKLYWHDLTSPTGESLVSSWQDIGFDLDGSTGIPDTRAQPTVFIFPNPSNDRIWLPSVSNRSPFELRGPDGRMLDHGSWPAEGLDISRLVPGSYVLSIKNADGYEHHRFIRD